MKNNYYYYYYRTKITGSENFTSNKNGDHYATPTFWAFRGHLRVIASVGYSTNPVLLVSYLFFIVTTAAVMDRC